LTTRSLFYSDDEIETLERVRKAKIKPPSKFRKDLPSDLEKIVMKSLGAKLKNRYKNGGEFAEAIQKFLKVNYPRSDLRTVAKFVRACLPDDFSKRMKASTHEGWKDVLRVGGADEDLLLDQAFGINSLTPTRYQR